MKLVRRLAWIVAIAGVLWTSAAIAEVSVDRRPNSARVDTITMSITDGVDPIPTSESWVIFRNIPSDRILNPTGGDRGDGRPDVAYHPVTGWPVAVWAYNNQTDHDIAISFWNGDRWTDPEFLTSSLEDEIDPRVFVEANGTLHVVWWVPSVDDERVVLLSRINEADAWEPALRISPIGEPGRRPTVAKRGSFLRIAYERDPSVDSTALAEIVVRRGSVGGEFVIEHVQEVMNDPIDPVLHVRQPASGGPLDLWLDWKHSGTQFGVAEFHNGSWGNTRLHPWPDTSWIGEQITRRTIASQVGQGGGGPVEPFDETPDDP